MVCDGRSPVVPSVTPAVLALTTLARLVLSGRNADPPWRSFCRSRDLLRSAKSETALMHKEALTSPLTPVHGSVDRVPGLRLSLPREAACAGLSHDGIGAVLADLPGKAPSVSASSEGCVTLGIAVA